MSTAAWAWERIVLDAIHAVRVGAGDLRVLLAGVWVVQLNVLLLTGGD